MKQQQAAQEALINWLSDEHELGAAPSRIECTGSFTLHGLCYYIFKYKKTPLGKWLLGVSGGYEENSTEHCGHVFSEMRPYDAATATKQASDMVEMIRQYWIQRAEEILSEQNDGIPSSTDDSIPAPGGLLSPIQRKRIRDLDNACEFFAILELLDEGVRNGNYLPEDLDGDLEAALWKAYACVNLDMYGMAERSLRRVRHKGEENHLWCYRYSVALMHLCRYEESLRYGRMATTIEPEYPWGWLQRARISYQAGEMEEALESVRRGLKLVPNDYEFLTTQQEIEELRPFSVMLDHFIDPTADQERQEDHSASPVEPNKDWFEEPGADWDGTSDDGRFVGFVLLSSPEWSPERFRKQLLADWGISCPAEAGETMSFPVGKDIVAVSLIPTPVPNGEAEENAAGNYLWPGAVNAAKVHQAQLAVAVLGRNEPKTETGKLFVKVCASCLQQESVLGLYASGTVFQPNFYLDAASVMPEGELPVLNWIHFGLCRTEKGISGYTFGMTAFDKDEIEVIDSGKSPQELRDFLLDVACYLLSEDITLKEGETIGFSSSQKLPVTRSEGIYVEGNTLKIDY